MRHHDQDRNQNVCGDEGEKEVELQKRRAGAADSPISVALSVFLQYMDGNDLSSGLIAYLSQCFGIEMSRAQVVRPTCLLLSVPIPAPLRQGLYKMVRGNVTDEMKKCCSIIAISRYLIHCTESNPQLLKYSPHLRHLGHLGV